MPYRLCIRFTEVSLPLMKILTEVDSGQPELKHHKFLCLCVYLSVVLNHVQLK